jgi:putative membrane-bound dehydrogenase-like protein
MTCALAACQPGTITPAPVTATVSTDPPLPPTSTETPTEVPTETATLVPTAPPSTVELEGAELPEGFSLIKFADLPNTTAIAFGPQGRMYATSLDGRVYVLTDEDNDGRADSQEVYSSGYNQPLGVAIHEATGDVYVSQRTGIIIARDTNADGIADIKENFVTGLPVDDHQNDNLEFGPDGWLYMGLGSTCDACQDPDPRSASILRFDTESGESEIFATGLRNPYDIAFHPETGDLFATDNGRDDLGLEQPFEELNHIIQDGDYGYPDCWNEQDLAGCEHTIPAVAFFEAHSSANGVDIYNGERFPAEYRGDVFVSIFGSGLKDVQTGIQRVVLTPAGVTYEGETSWFVRFPDGTSPLPLKFGPDGALYVGEFRGDAIYRISYGLP